MSLTPFLAAGALAAGLAAATCDDLHAALVKLLHGGAAHADAAPGDEHEDATALGVLHAALERLDLPHERLAALHERLVGHAGPVHEALSALTATRGTHLRAVLAVPFDPAALEPAAAALGDAQRAFASAIAAFHASLRQSLEPAERDAFDAAREAVLEQAEAAAAARLQALQHHPHADPAR